MRRAKYVVIEVGGESGPVPPTPEEQLAIVKALPVEATIAALTAGRSPTPLLTVQDVHRQLRTMFGHEVTLVSERIRSREEDR